MTYRSTEVIERPRGEWNVRGNLTIRGVTRPTPLIAHFGGSITDSFGKPRAAFHASGTITRSTFGLVAELSKEAGSMMIGDDITIDIEAEVIRSHGASH
jgi:polyisoprenoid-binding protein YceI